MYSAHGGKKCNFIAKICLADIAMERMLTYMTSNLNPKTFTHGILTSGE